MATNIKEILVQGAAYPAAVEAALPAGAPVVSTMLLDAAEQIPVVPDFPMAIPDLPAPPEMPAQPALRRAGRGRAVTTVREVPASSMVTQRPLGQEILS